MEHNLTAAAFRRVPKTGVIYVTAEAEARGFSTAPHQWCNLGQGQPETRPLPGGPARLTELEIHPDAHEYAPVSGLPELRDAVAQMYNRQFRRGLPSQYSAENVAICGGGRLALARASVALGEVNLGHFLPDYTAYEELLSIFRLFIAIPILLDSDRGYAFSVDDLRTEILGKGLSAVLLSNPANPTGKTIAGDELGDWVKVARELGCAMLVDEFYSHYLWKDAPGQQGNIVSAAAHVDDVNKDPVLIFDGLTKNWRYPGLRLSWTVGPKDVISAVSSAGSFLDGGGNRPTQSAAIPLLEDAVVTAETNSIRQVFSEKRDFLCQRLLDLGIKLELKPEGGFYVWGSVDDLPPHMNDAMKFFRTMLEHQVISVPGPFFDINPGGRRPGRRSRFDSHLRFSFGPELSTLKTACDRIESAIASGR